ncbi:hypothetical protein FC56_GL000918 [Lentilactobacillus senioris DSM 24302 = JCM 17472]|uniref:Uncharacterized protein n=1 Tax=Lentilactobacillus senioris DSM 24302 = JCM 17472 TaxID=1423802 RepID=A0A0R2CPN0_9LACO|nr:hypothetical protein [Lentilactobacillus senioris]KRM93253.1 hypothetical protein FC56_GL000918 [Lentilactobacillus senioris DSM 24302 = JCM 17472]MCY9806462.1 hypothetical protein [Lentilactobacillus senioris]
MMTAAKLQDIVTIFKQYNIQIETNEMLITKINQREVEFDANSYMVEQLIQLITRVLADEINKQVWGLLK